MARYIIKFCKGNGVKFISHLDLMRCVQRTVRRAGIPISYSKGFNPHAEMSFATPLSVGISSNGEYLDMKLEKNMDAPVIMEMINSELPCDIRFTSISEVDDNFPTLMSMVDAASYEITTVGAGENKLTQSAVDDFLNNSSIEVVKMGKNGERLVDIKPMIYSLRLLKNDGIEAVLKAIVSTGSKNNLNPQLLIKAMINKIEGLEEMEVRDILKLETYIKKCGQFKTPMELI